MKKCERCC